MAHLITNTFFTAVMERYSNFTRSWEAMTHDFIVSKSESNDYVSLHSIFFWTDIKEIFYYFTYFSVEEYCLNLSIDIVE
jgi:hypothetical protein